jgi:hypothetical protein
MFLFLCSVFASAQVGDKSKQQAAQEENQGFETTAEKMKKSYDTGDLNEVIRLYNKHCLKDGKEKAGFKQAKKKTRADIYQWVTLSYMALDMPEQGNICLEKLLALRPYERVDNYWLSIRQAARGKYYTAPRLLVGVKMGSNVTFARPTRCYSFFNPTNENESMMEQYHKDYSSGLSHSWGTQWGFIAEYTLTKNFSVSLQPSLYHIKFRYINEYNWTPPVTGVVDAIDARLTHDQSLYYIELPLVIKYRLVTPGSQFHPYLQIGGFFRIREAANKSIEVTMEPEIATFTGEDKIDIRKRFAWGGGGILIGAGIGYDARGIRVEAEVNFKYQFNNIVNGKYRDDNQQLVFAYFDVFDDMKLKNWDLSINILLPLSFKVFRR